MSSFLKYLGVDVRPHVKHANGASYIPWATQLALAGRPDLTIVVNANTGPVREVFGGGVVAVDQPTEAGVIQRTYLPVMGMKSEAIPYEKIHARDVGDTISRVRARSVASVSGLGLSLYTPLEGDGPAYVDVLGVSPDKRDLAKVATLVDEKMDGRSGRVISKYLGWFNAVAAARITDPGFRWEVLEFPHVDTKTGEVREMPAQKCPGTGWMVAVRIHWKGRNHTEWLPIMGMAKVQTKNGAKTMDHQPLSDPDATDWHRSVMRCLAKGIAICTGYGIDMYADDVEDPFARDPDEQRESDATSVSHASDDPEHAQLVEAVKELVARTNTPTPKALSFLRASSFEAASVADLKRVADLLGKRPVTS